MSRVCSVYRTLDTEYTSSFFNGPTFLLLYDKPLVLDQLHLVYQQCIVDNDILDSGQREYQTEM